MPLPHSTRRALWISTAVGLVAVQILFRGPSRSFLWSVVLDAGHAPLYGTVALAALHVLRTRAGWPGDSKIRSYAMALALAVAAGVLAELIQGLGSGDADAGDVARDALGAASFLLVAFAFDGRLLPGRNRVRRATLLLLAALLLACAFIPLGMTSLALLQRDAAFPGICGFDARWEKTFVSANEADMEKVRPPEEWRRLPSDRVARLVFGRGDYPGLSIEYPHPNWTGYKELVFDVYSQLQEPVELILRIHDMVHNNDYWDRFNRVLTIRPGANRISVPLSDLRVAPRGRRMDLSRISGLALFADHPPEPFVLYLDDFRLE